MPGPKGQPQPIRLADDLRYQRFVAAFVVCLDAKQAAIEAGFSPRTAHVTGHKMLKRPDIAQAVAEAQTKLQVRSDITADKVLAELALLAFSSVDHYEIDDDGKVKVTAEAPKGAIRAVSSIKRRVTTDAEGNVTREVEMRLWDKPGPLKTAGRHVGLFNDKALNDEQLNAAVDKRIEELREAARQQRERTSIAVRPTEVTQRS